MAKEEITGARIADQADHPTVSAAVEVLSGDTSRRGLTRLWPFLGPAFVASVAYIDPGNFATNLEGGARFGFTLVWVVVASNLIAMLVQTMAAKLGIATGRNLAELCRIQYPRWLVLTMWVVMELVAMATDLAEFLGAAIGFNLLFGMPLWIAGLLTAVVTFIILGLERYGFRPLEAVITALVGVVALCYLIEMFIVRPQAELILESFLPPRFQGPQSILLATGILGATVMPHVIYLHSALTQSRIRTREPGRLKKLFRYEVIDVILAMTIAGAINAAMLIMAAQTFHTRGMLDVDAIDKAYLTLEPLLGPLSSQIFAISLLMAGLSSSAVGTMSGQIIMQGFLDLHVPVWVRRVVTMLPALVVIFLGLDPTWTLVLSQVVLSFGLPLAVIPLVRFTSRADLMGVLTNRRLTSVLAWTAAGLIVSLNLFLIYQIVAGG